MISPVWQDVDLSFAGRRFNFRLPKEEMILILCSGVCEPLSQVHIPVVMLHSNSQCYLCVEIFGPITITLQASKTNEDSIQSFDSFLVTSPLALIGSPSFSQMLPMLGSCPSRTVSAGGGRFFCGNTISLV